jgi:hypothetical protein
MNPKTKSEFERYSNALARSLASAILATRESDVEARVYCRTIMEMRLALDTTWQTVECLRTVDWDKSIAEVEKTGRVVLELKNGSAIVFLIESGRK